MRGSARCLLPGPTEDVTPPHNPQNPHNPRSGDTCPGQSRALAREIITAERRRIATETLV